MRQQAITVGSDPALVGVVTHPDREARLPMVLLLNAGMVHRIGPNRLYVRLANRLAAIGFRSLRFDLSGIGDSLPSEGPLPFEQRALQEVRAVMALASRRYGVEHFVPVGLCSGADVGYALALSDERIVAAALINGGFVGVSAELLHEAQERIQVRFHQTRLLNRESWKRLITLRSDLGAVRRTLSRVLRRGSPTAPRPSISEPLDARGIRILRIHSEGSFTWDLLQLIFGPEGRSLQGQEHVRLERIAGSDHVFTPLWAQERLLSAVCGWADALPEPNARSTTNEG